MEQQQTRVVENQATAITQNFTANNSQTSRDENSPSMIEVPRILEGWLARLTPEAREVVLADMAKKKRQSEENLSKLRAEIGSWISPLDAENIQLARQDAEICGRCEGFPCPKTTCQFATRQVKIDLVNQQVELRAGNCKILRAQLQALRDSSAVRRQNF